jgi:hypothetical protein
MNPFQGDIDAYLNELLPTWRWAHPHNPAPMAEIYPLAAPTPRQQQLEQAMESGFPPISGDVDPRTRKLRWTT